MLVEHSEIICEQEKPANIVNNCFTNITTHVKFKSAKIDPKASLESIINTFQNYVTY